MRAGLIYNPSAGQRDKTDDVAQVKALLDERGVELLFVEPILSQGDATRFAQKAVSLECDALLVSGGDGTVAQAVDGLVGTETALAVLPGGTGNVLARQLGLPIPGSLRPRAVTEALEALLAGSARRVDVGQITNLAGVRRHFMCWCGLGFDAQVTLEVAQQPERKQRLGKMAFLVAGLLTLGAYRGHQVTLRVDGHRSRRRVIMLEANNIQLYGVWLKIAPRAVIDDGWLDVYCFQGRGMLHTLMHGVRLLFGQHLQDPDVDFYRARRIEISSKRRLPVHGDGDVVCFTPATIRVLPRALRLLVPAGAPSDLFLDGAAVTDVRPHWQWVTRLARDLGGGKAVE
jgi:diacylglycerol kinase (ATP)